MIQLSRNYSLPEREEQIIPIKLIAVGSAGSNALDRVVLDGMDKSDLIAANTDAQSLASSVAAVKVQLGRSLTRGLGTGGDPELGFDAAQEAADEIRQALTQARLIFICAGLGGGTGSGAAPVIAQIAREMGALVIGFATLPFTFEGKRRAAQAQQALSRLHELADAVVCFENDRMGDLSAPKAGIHQAFAMADMTVSQSLRSIVNLIQRPGIMRIGFDDLLAALRGGGGRCLFGYGESDSDNRAHEALEQALKNPLMDRGRMLEEAARVLVQVSGGPGMTLSEVEILMRDLNKHISDETQLLFGTAVDGRMGNRLSVTLITSLGGEIVEAPPVQERKPRREIAPPPPPPEIVVETAPEPIVAVLPETPQETPSSAGEINEPVAENGAADLALEEEITEPELTVEQPEAELSVEPEPEPAPAPRIIPPKKKTGVTPPNFSAPKILPKPEPEKQSSRQKTAKQETLQFEPLTRGRFEKSEPTIVEGQDLDVPTFLRKNVRVK
jgi:cell division protein FtsZ